MHELDTEPSKDEFATFIVSASEHVGIKRVHSRLGRSSVKDGVGLVPEVDRVSGIFAPFSHFCPTWVERPLY